MAGKTYTLDRDRRPPHLDQPYKRCETCNQVKRNDYTEFPKQQWGPRKYGMQTTGSTCKACVAAAISKARQSGRDRNLTAEELMSKDAMDGKYLGSR
jgi:hypothetical protein